MRHVTPRNWPFPQFMDILYNNAFIGVTWFIY